MVTAYLACTQPWIESPERIPQQITKLFLIIYTPFHIISEHPSTPTTLNCWSLFTVFIHSEDRSICNSHPESIMTEGNTKVILEAQAQNHTDTRRLQTPLMKECTKHIRIYFFKQMTKTQITSFS